MGSPAPCTPPSTQPGWRAQPHALPSPRPSLPPGSSPPEKRRDTKPWSRATLGRGMQSTRQEPGTAASETSPRAAVPFPADTAPRGGEAGLSSGAMPRNRPLLLEAGAHRPPPGTCRQGRQPAPRQPPASWSPRPARGSGRSVLPARHPPGPGSFCSCQIYGVVLGFFAACGLTFNCFL